MPRESSVSTAYGVHCLKIPACNDRKIIYLTNEEYNYQLCRADRRWECPRCSSLAVWNDGNFDEMEGT